MTTIRTLLSYSIASVLLTSSLTVFASNQANTNSSPKVTVTLGDNPRDVVLQPRKPVRPTQRANTLNTDNQKSM